jgi:imidazoleglycerol phosphate synthase cyclase subunit
VVGRVLTRRIIPCLDTRDGRVVKGRRFQDLRDVGSPAALASRYQHDGADEIVILDVVATDRDRAHALEAVREVRRDLALPLTVGGGVRSVADAARLLEAGADKVGVNTAALMRPALLDELAREFGCQCVTLSIDAARDGAGWQVYQRSGAIPADRDAVGWAKEATARGAGEILLTSIDRDGTREGYDLGLTRAVSAGVTVPVIASGGARTVSDLADALAAGADAVLAASMFHDGDTSVRAVKLTLQARGVEIRP